MTNTVQFDLVPVRTSTNCCLLRPLIGARSANPPAQSVRTLLIIGPPKIHTVDSQIKMIMVMFLALLFIIPSKKDKTVCTNLFNC
jgi:hypothetical protein